MSLFGVLSLKNVVGKCLSSFLQLFISKHSECTGCEVLQFRNSCVTCGECNVACGLLKASGKFLRLLVKLAQFIGRQLADFLHAFEVLTE